MLKCEVIQDLLPLYHDGVASAESKLLVDEHLKQCSNCRKILETVQNGSLIEPLDIDYAEIGILNKVKNELRMKKIITAFISITVALALVYGIFFLPFSLPYSPEKIKVSISSADGLIDIYYNGNYQGINARAEGDALYIGYHGTVFTQIWQGGDALQFTVGPNSAIDFGRSSEYIPITEQINRIFYLDFRSIRDDDFMTVRESAELIWER